MSKEQIIALVEGLRVSDGTKLNGLVPTPIPGVSVFHVVDPVPCMPAVYQPCLVAVLSGTKEAVIGGKRHVYDSQQYLCCSLSIPVEVGAPSISASNPLIGVFVPLDQKVMMELALELRSKSQNPEFTAGEAQIEAQGIALARWDLAFTDALTRLLELGSQPDDAATLGPGRLRELFYAVLKGGAGWSIGRSFGVEKDMARAIEFLSSNLQAPVSIEDLSDHMGMSRAVVHRKFKQATAMSPIQYMKSLRLAKAAKEIGAGMTVSQAADLVGYSSPSQFSREFKRAFGKSPKDWSRSNQSLWQAQG